MSDKAHPAANEIQLTLRQNLYDGARPHQLNQDQKQDVNDNERGSLLLFLLLFSIGTTMTLYSNVAIFLPPFVLKYHATISATQNGIILGMFEAAMLLSSPVITSNLSKFGRKNVILFGYACDIVACFGFALLIFIQSDNLFFSFACFFRFVQGFGDACIGIAVISVITSEFPAMRHKYIGWSEASVGVGIMIGPTIGDVLYSFFGFGYTFISLAAFLLAQSIVILICIPARINRNVQQTTGQAIVDIEITYTLLFWNFRVIMVVISSMVGFISLMFFYPLFSNRIAEFGLTLEKIGYLFSGVSLLYIIFCQIVAFLCRRIQKQFLVQFSLTFGSFGVFMFGPSKLLGFTNNIYVSVIGFGIMHICIPFFFIPIIPEIIEAVQEKEAITRENQSLNDKASGLYITLYAAGNTIAPIIGGFYNDTFKFRTACDIIACQCLGFSIVYFFTNVLPIIMRQQRQNSQQFPTL